jgi:16S rRNA processing protein RimM
MSSSENRLTEIARIGKVHGLDGTVRLQPDDDLEYVIEKNSVLFLQNRRGDLIPARVTDIRVEKKRNKRLFFVKFDRIADRTEAEQFQDRPVFSDIIKSQTDNDPEDSDITGFTIIDESGIVGTVSGVMDNPAHPIIEAAIHEIRETDKLLIPWVDEYVNSIDRKQKKVICHNLDQLISN